MMAPPPTYPLAVRVRSVLLASTLPSFDKWIFTTIDRLFYILKVDAFRRNGFAIEKENGFAIKQLRLRRRTIIANN